MVSPRSNVRPVRRWLDVELTGAAGEDRLGLPGDALVLVRREGTPIALIRTSDALPLAAALSGHGGEVLDVRAGDDVRVGGGDPSDTGPSALAASDTSADLGVVIPVLRPSARLLRLLESLRAMPAAPEAIVVALNGGDDGDVRLPGDVRVVRCPDVGTSLARNAGAQVLSTELVAFLDDDVVPEPQWATRLRQSFAARPGVDWVSGLVLPLLDARPGAGSGCLTFEEHGGFGKGLTPRTFTGSVDPADPLYPFRAGILGTGANLAVRRRSWQRLGGFDPRLGAGTPLRGGEDLEVLVRCLLDEGSVHYEPTMIVAHPIAASMTALRRRTFAYGWGLGAMIGQIFRGRAECRSRLLALTPAGLAVVVRRRGYGPAGGRRRLVPLPLRLVEATGIAGGFVAGMLAPATSRPAASAPAQPVLAEKGAAWGG